VQVSGKLYVPAALAYGKEFLCPLNKRRWLPKLSGRGGEEKFLKSLTISGTSISLSMLQPNALINEYTGWRKSQMTLDATS